MQRFGQERIDLLFIGPAGAGKSTLVKAWANQFPGWTAVEGDDFISQENRKFLSAFLENKQNWGANFGSAFAGSPAHRVATAMREQDGHVVAALTALMKAARDYCRSLVPRLRMVFLELDPAAAVRRQNERTEPLLGLAELLRQKERDGEGSFSDLVAKHRALTTEYQYATMQRPGPDEPLTLCIDATLPPQDILQRVADWIEHDQSAREGGSL